MSPLLIDLFLFYFRKYVFGLLHFGKFLFFVSFVRNMDEDQEM